MTARRVAGWFFNIEIAALVLLLCATLVPNLFGVKAFAVMSGSMEPAIETGSLAYVQTKTTGEEIVAGDVVAFDISSGAVVTHRVVENNAEARALTTKGDANELTDGNPVSYDDLVGKLVLDVPRVGYLFISFEANKFAWIVAIVFANIALAGIAWFWDRFIGKKGKGNGEGEEQQSL